jgi:carboxymethylenebutenolidase
MKAIKDELDSLLSNPERATHTDRRSFLQVALGTGFAAAVLPTLSQAAISTDSDGLEAGTVNMLVGEQVVPMYRAQPKGGQQLPVVLVVSEIFGVHQHIADVARRFAKLGYLALAPDLFVRQGDPSKPASIPELLRDIVSKVPDAQVMQDLDACVAWAYRNGGDTSKLAITGFCWGGRITWMYAAHNPQVRAGAAWYGRLQQDKNSLQPSNPIDKAGQLRVPVLGLYGGKDGGIPLETVESMRAALAQGKSGSEIRVYPNAGHGFHADYRPGYVELDAQDAWARCLQWFRQHGVAA